MSNYKITITPDILNLISELDKFKVRWQQAINSLSLGLLGTLKRSATIESISSSTSECFKLNDAQAKTLLSKMKRKSFKSRDEEEGDQFLIKLIFTKYLNIELYQIKLIYNQYFLYA
jgi:hypothetical protein